MDAAAAAVYRKSMGFAPSCYGALSSKESRSFSGSVMVVRKRSPTCGILSSGFCDQGHLQYYYNSNNSVSSSSSSALMMGIRSEKLEKTQKKMKKKKQLKLLKGLSKDLSNFSHMGFGLDLDGGALVDQVKGDMLSDAAEVLLQRLQKLRAEEKEHKKRMKQEKKSKLKASQLQNNCEMSSSSSSSSSDSNSSDSECGEVVNMKNLKRAQNYQNTPPQQNVLTVAGPTTLVDETGNMGQINIPGPAIPESKTGNLVQDNVSMSVAPSCCKKIEVCMGGKCKKSGGAQLLEQFQKVVGIEGSVSGCKCMGKCREGPNVKVLNGGGDESSVRIAPSSLCIGVGLEDVDMIVANLLGENQHNQLGFAAAT